MKAISLPLGPIDWFDLLTLISRHDVQGPEDLRGVACISRKRNFIVLEQSPSRDEWHRAGYPYDDEVPGVYTLEEELSSEERALLAGLLLEHDINVLDLYPGMSDAEISAFIAKYRALPGRPAWEPMLYSRTDLARIKSLRWESRAVNAKRLLEEVTAGTIRVQNPMRVRKADLQPGYQLRRADAIRFLEMLDVQHVPLPTPIATTQPAPLMATVPVAGVMVSDALLRTSSTSPSTAVSVDSHRQRGEPWTMEEVQKLKDLYDQCRNISKVGRAFGISRTRVNYLLKKHGLTPEKAVHPPSLPPSAWHP